MADGDHLHEGHHNGHRGGGHRAKGKAADADDDILEIEIQETVDTG